MTPAKLSTMPWAKKKPPNKARIFFERTEKAAPGAGSGLFCSAFRASRAMIMFKGGDDDMKTYRGANIPVARGAAMVTINLPGSISSRPAMRRLSPVSALSWPAPSSPCRSSLKGPDAYASGPFFFHDRDPACTGTPEAIGRTNFVPLYTPMGLGHTEAAGARPRH